MIRLQLFNVQRVLAGARVPLSTRLLLVRTGVRTCEWSGDHMTISVPGLARALRVEAADILTEISDLALDPAQEDTARLIDRRIAERIGSDRPGRLFLYLLDGTGWAIGSTAWSKSGQVDEHSQRAGIPDCPGMVGVDLVEANLPVVRGLLLQLLYPPEAS